MSGNGDFEEESYGTPLQIISIDEENSKFKLNEVELEQVMARVPKGMKLSVVSIVGAFRTGKSFLLDFFLKYLRLPQTKIGREAWSNLFTSKSSKLEGNSNEKVSEGDKNNDSGFSWRSGTERNTMGIWLWSKPFVRKVKETGESVAVLLVDSQGIFDSRLTQMMAASIFGLSTLLSSYQIYNVQNRLQEDHLQHLALFTEYGRVTLRAQESSGDNNNKAKKAGTDEQPFQVLQFLVRDFQFESKDRSEDKMTEYLQNFLSVEDRQQKDLREIREHIRDSFEKVSIFLLPHPGFDVPDPEYDGEVSKIRDVFREMLEQYVPLVFNRELRPKTINGNFITSMEFKHFIRAFVKIFADGNAFPEPTTLLAATAEVNNRCANDAAYDNYVAEMDQLCGPGKMHVPEPKLLSHHNICLDAALSKYRSKATLGSRSMIKKFELELTQKITKKKNEYVSINSDRDPYKNLEFYVLPAMICVSAYFVSMVGGWVCWTPQTPEFDFEIADVCQRGINLVNFVYGGIFWFFMVMFAVMGRQAWDRIQLILQANGMMVRVGGAATESDPVGTKLKSD